ncbi:hypothetical protein JVW63_06745 [Flaviflexus sp. JY899]|uniref:Uncharacterized protein n=2 Tax=Flaviflexus equikiangi TaxID=2758573 RepID=A0ABS2TFG2_9ACTO|nr:hypothetical protein [Flaviflexus equikiangi]
MSSAPATEDPEPEPKREPEPTEEAEPTEVPETIEETTTLAPDIDEWSNGPLAEPAPQFVPMPEPSEESIATPAGPSQADIEYVRAERAYLEDQILQSDAYIARKTAALETSQYHLAVAEDYGDTLRARELRAEIKTLEADINTERLYGDMLRAELQALPDW